MGENVQATIAELLAVHFPIVFAGEIHCAAVKECGWRGSPSDWFDHTSAAIMLETHLSGVAITA